MSANPAWRRLLCCHPLATGLLLSALWGCSTPMAPSRTAAAPTPTPAPTAPAPTPVPLTKPPAKPAPAVSAPSPAAPYNAAVAARFPEPQVVYRTPAFEPGHSGFTSNAELQAAMRTLVQTAATPAGQPGVSLLRLGTSQKGLPLEALLFTRSADTSPTAVLAANLPTVLLVGQQHGDEPAGSEALLVLAQELARGRLQGLLERINVLILPRANPDGAAVQQRVTASGIDANRDHLLLKTPEAQAQAQLAREFRPLVVVDAHEYTVVGRYLEKFGAVQRFDALVQYAMTANLPPFITKASEEWFRRPMIANLAQQGLSTEWYYTTSTDLADKKVSMGGTQPDTGRNVNGLKNAVSILIETRGVGLGNQHLLRRVHTQVTAISSVLQSAAARANDLIKLRQYVDNEVSAQACQGDAVVEAGPTASEYALTMLDPVTGTDKVVTVEWASSLMLSTLKTRARPCGYWLAADQTGAVQRLRGLGVRVVQLAETGVVHGETYRETAREVGVRQEVLGSIADAGGVLRVQVELVAALVDAPVGSYYVPLDQPLANLVIAALEPDTQNSYVSHGIVSSVAAQARVLQRPEVRVTTLP
jgi:hypothetical protein